MTNITLEFLAISFMDLHVAAEIARFDGGRANFTNDFTPSIMRRSNMNFEYVQVFKRLLTFIALKGSR